LGIPGHFVNPERQNPAEAGSCLACNEVLLHCPTSQLGQRLADIGKRANGFNACVFQCSKLLVGSTFAAGDDCTSVTHALACRSSYTSDVGHNRLGYIGLDVGCSFFFSATADLTDHDDRFGLRIVLEHFQDVDEVGARDRVATDTHAGGLTETGVSGLLYRFVGQGAGAGDDAHFTWQVDVPGLDAGLALAGGDDARAVGPDQAYAQLITLDLALEHVEGGDAFGDADD